MTLVAPEAVRAAVGVWLDQILSDRNHGDDSDK